MGDLLLRSVFLGAFASLFPFLLIRFIYDSFDHGYYSGSDILSPQAKITGCDSVKFSMGKNDTRFRTTVTFSDGFTYVSTKTNRENHFMRYSISIDANLRAQILQNAITSHSKAVIRKQQHPNAGSLARWQVLLFPTLAVFVALTCYFPSILAQ